MSHDPYVNRPQPLHQPRFDDPPRSNNKLLWILGILGGTVVLGILICCGGFYALMNFGMNTVAEDIRIQLRDHPTIQEQIGEIQHIEVAFGASMAHEDDETFVYNVTGSKADGELTVKSITHFDDSEEIVTATLRTEQGQTFELEL